MKKTHEEAIQALADFAEGKISEAEAVRIYVAAGGDPDDAREQCGIAQGEDDNVVLEEPEETEK